MTSIDDKIFFKSPTVRWPDAANKISLCVTKIQKWSSSVLQKSQTSIKMTCRLCSIDLLTRLDLVQKSKLVQLFFENATLIYGKQNLQCQKFHSHKYKSDCQLTQKNFIYLSVTFLKIICTNFDFGSNLKSMFKTMKKRQNDILSRVSF